VNIVPLTERRLPILLKWINELPDAAEWDMRSLRQRSLDDQESSHRVLLVAEEDGEPLGFLLGNVRQEKGWITAMVVRGDRRRQGIGGALLKEAETRFLGVGITHVTVGWSPYTLFTAGWDVRYTSALCFMEKYGYRTERKSRVNMYVDLAGRDFGTEAEEKRLAEQGITFRRGTLADREGAIELANSNSMAWGDEVRMSYQNDPASLFVAEKDGKLVHFACYGSGAPMYFGPTLTLPEMRGLGIGAVGLKRCMADLQRLGWGRCEINWAGPLGFYARTVGAYIGRVLWSWEKELK
jgi:GNAT superfamily N-acetyltransferase